MDVKDLFNSFFVSGGFLPLNNREQQLASIVFPVALEAVSKIWDLQQKVSEPLIPDAVGAPVPPANRCHGDFEVKVEAAKENLVKILYLFGKIHNARNEFSSAFPNWTKIRKSNIADLEALGKSLHQDRFNCNVSRLVGSSVGALGGLALVACLFPPVAIVAAPLAIAGGGAALAGGGVVFGTTLTEYGLIKQKMTGAQNILKDDQDCFMSMTKYFEHTIKFVEAVDAVLGFDVLTTLAKDLKDFTNDVTNWDNRFFRQLKRTFTTILTTIQIPLASMGLQLVTVALTIGVIAVLAHCNNCIILDGIILTHRLVFGFLSGLDLGVDVGRALMTFARGGKLTADISNQLSRAVFRGVFGGVGLTLDVINIVLTSIDVHKGSFSKQGKMVLNAADQLSKELEVLEKVYNELKRGPYS
ncbi:hypothetical protein JTE90_006836 [Oedothorax gibbosus]|uniref:Uncharacterized protein n=1 Tax=Oedothorax gibbosus TaxID=931172 RepID=A0AAV6TVH5_9ARAC|nr:hypothetical protein JTE90_006836 [Oedothorax gibbosus]